MPRNLPFSFLAFPWLLFLVFSLAKPLVLKAEQENKLGEAQMQYLEAVKDSLFDYRNGENNQRMAYWLEELDFILKSKPKFENRTRYEINYHFYQAIYRFNIVQLKEALAYSDTALKLLDQFPIPSTRTAVLTQIANAHTELGDQAAANRSYQEALASFDQWEKVDSLGYHGINMNWANSLSRSGQFEKAFEKLNQSRDFFEREEHQLYRALAENNLGELYREVFNECAKAKKHYHQAVKLNLAVGNNYQLSQNYNNLGICSEVLGDVDSAVYYFEKAIALREKLGDLSNAAASMHGLASLYAQEGDYNKALPLFRRVYQISQKYQVAQGLFFTASSLGNLYMEQGSLDSAEFWLERALSFGEKFQIFEETIPLLENLVTLYEKQKRYPKALDFHRQLKEVSDSFSQLRNEESLQSLKSNVEKEAAERENSFLRQLNELKEDEIGDQKRVIAFTSLAVIIFVILSLLLLRSLKKQTEAKAALKVSRDKLEVQNRRLSESEENLAQTNQMKDRILSVLGHDLRSPLASLSALLGALSAQAITREELLSFMERLKVQTDDSLLALESVLSWAQAQKERGARLKAEDLHLKKYVEESFQIYAPGARAKNLQMDFDAPLGLESVFADPAMFRSMLGNLLSNAIKFSKEEGSIQVSFKKEQNFHLIKVCDNGIGMTRERLSELNQDDGLLKSTQGTYGEKGTGIGLSLVKDFVRMHRGRLEFSLRPEGGVCATLYLPVKSAN